MPSARCARRRTSGALAPARVARLDADQASLEVDGAPAQRQQLPQAQAAECGRGEDRGVRIVVGGSDQRVDLGRLEEVVAAQGAPCFDSARTLYARDGVRTDAVGLAGAAKDAVEVDQVLADRAGRRLCPADGAVSEAPLSAERGLPALDVLGGDLLKGPVAQFAAQPVCCVAVVHDGGVLDLRLVLLVAQPLVSRLSQRHPAMGIRHALRVRRGREQLLQSLARILGGHVDRAGLGPVCRASERRRALCARAA